MSSRVAKTFHFIFYHKTPSKYLRIPVFLLCFAKKFCGPRQKREERSVPAVISCAWAGLWPAVSTSQSFQTFLRHNVGNSECHPYSMLAVPSLRFQFCGKMIFILKLMIDKQPIFRKPKNSKTSMVSKFQFFCKFVVCSNNAF